MTSLLYASVCGLALAAASALPDRHLAGEGRKKLDDFLHDSDSPQDEYESETKTKTNYQYAEASCSVGTFTSEYSGYKDSFIGVVVDVYKNACSADFDYHYIEGKIYSFAEVWAAATAEVYVDCSSSASESGYAEGCGYGEAAAKAFNFAFAGAYAKAAAEIVDNGHCSCGKENIWTEVQASLFQVLTADVFAKAKAAACVSGNDYADAYAYVDCYASVFTTLFAEAIANVVIDGSCYYGNGADVYAYVDSISYEYASCTRIVSSSPGGKGEGKGGASTSS